MWEKQQLTASPGFTPTCSSTCVATTIYSQKQDWVGKSCDDLHHFTRSHIVRSIITSEHTSSSSSACIVFPTTTHWSQKQG